MKLKPLPGNNIIHCGIESYCCSNLLQSPFVYEWVFWYFFLHSSNYIELIQKAKSIYVKSSGLDLRLQVELACKRTHVRGFQSREAHFLPRHSLCSMLGTDSG
jgi:hypothetical protein